jgi:hypothetical protein
MKRCCTPKGYQIRYMAAAAIITHAVTTKPCSILSMITPNPTGTVIPF